MKKVEHYVYPAVFTFEKGKEISVDFPDLNVATSGINKKDALLSAKELLNIVLNGLQEDKEEIPTPTPLDKINHKPNEEVILVNTFNTQG